METSCGKSGRKWIFLTEKIKKPFFYEGLNTLFTLILVYNVVGVFVLENETLTLSVPKRLKDELRKMNDVNWSEETRRFLEERVKRRKVFKLLDELTKNSQLTEQDAIELGKVVNKGMWQKHYKKMV